MDIPKPVGQQLEQKLVEIISQIQAGVVEAGKAAGNMLPKLTEVAIRMTYWEGVAMIGMSVGFFILTFLIFKLGKWFTNQEYDKWGMDFENAPQWIGVILYIVSAICFIVGAYNVLQPWNWVAVFDPEVALAHKILIMILNKGSSGG